MTMKLPITIFSELNEVRERHGFTQEEWATACGMKQPRIAEFASIASGSKSRRKFTVEKCLLLVSGLKSLLGADMFKKEALANISKEGDSNLKIIKFAIFIVTMGDNPTKDKVASFLEIIINSMK